MCVSIKKQNDYDSSVITPNKIETGNLISKTPTLDLDEQEVLNVQPPQEKSEVDPNNHVPLSIVNVPPLSSQNDNEITPNVTSELKSHSKDKKIDSPQTLVPTRTSARQKSRDYVHKCINLQK